MQVLILVHICQSKHGSDKNFVNITKPQCILHASWCQGLLHSCIYYHEMWSFPCACHEMIENKRVQSQPERYVI